MSENEKKLIEIAKKAIEQYMLYVCYYDGETTCDKCQNRKTCEKMKWQRTVDRIEKESKK